MTSIHQEDRQPHDTDRHARVSVGYAQGMWYQQPRIVLALPTAHGQDTVALLSLTQARALALQLAGLVDKLRAEPSEDSV